MEQSGSSNHNGDEGIISEYSSERKPQIIGTPSVDGKRLPQNEHNQKPKILVADLMCPMCKQMLIHPVGLNCGHGSCSLLFSLVYILNLSIAKYFINIFLYLFVLILCSIL
jgi:hypothetical protein